ncbi:MAG TPA: HAMP domain-containing sensor histidine kinase [Kofleriaceae bacterium]|nr:HAMP domain-containing sensor histidine kinase [Kofleriaceae bacterium]
MNEVSCQVFSIFMRSLRRKGVGVETLVANTSVPISKLRDKKARIDWAEFVVMMRNMRPHFSDEEFVEIGRTFLRSPALKFAFVVGRLLFTPMEFYRWFHRPHEGVGNQLFSCVVPAHRELSDSEIEVDFTVPEGYEVSREFHLVSIGNAIELPRLLGAPASEVTLTPLPNGGRYHIKLAPHNPLRRKIWRFLIWPFTARTAAKELKAAHETLQERYNELEAAKAKLVEHQANLEKQVEERTHDLREARDDLAANVEQLKEAQGARERFFGNISHEIRTPLSLIMLSAADVEARAGSSLDSRSRAGLGAVNDAARKLVRLVDELLLLAAGQEGKLRVHPEPTDLAGLIVQLAAAWRPAAEAAGLELSTEVPDKLVVNCDPIAFERIASNLLSNAVKYTPRGGHIALHVAVDDQEIRLSVLDTGPGIDADLAKRLFGRFERTEGEARRKMGSGIGLSLVKQLVEAHGGTVAALARPDKGSELRVVLPSSRIVREGPLEARKLELAAPQIAGMTSGTRFEPPGISGGTIVIAEDEPKLAEALARLLAEHYTVIVGLDGNAALDLVKQHKPQLLITDVDMPGMNGIELSRKFREVSGDQLAPIIILSAVVDRRTRVSGLEAGAVDYVAKPFDGPELLARVASQLRMRELALRVQRAEKLSSLAILTSGLAHEIRNPANGIVNAIPPLLAMLPEELTGADSPSGQLFEVVGSCAEQIGLLSRQLLNFREGKLELRQARMQDLVSRAIALSQRALVDVEVRSDIHVDAPIMCAPALLTQVFANLIDNAGQAAGKGGWVQIGGTTEGGRVTVEVTDSGPGVPRELRERVFEPFFTTKPPGVGTGLGLPLARTIVHRHGGVLEIRERASRPVFVIELPQGSAAHNSTASN